MSSEVRLWEQNWRRDGAEMGSKNRGVVTLRHFLLCLRKTELWLSSGIHADTVNAHGLCVYTQNKLQK